MKRVTYLLTEALTNIRLNQTTTIVAVATTAFTMACFGVFLLLYLNLRGVTSTLQDDIKVVVYVTDAVSAQALADLQARIKSDREVAGVTYVSKEQALTDFREQFPSEGYLLQGLGENPLPASLLVAMAHPSRSSEAVKRWADRSGYRRSKVQEWRVARPVRNKALGVDASALRFGCPEHARLCREPINCCAATVLAALGGSADAT